MINLEITTLRKPKGVSSWVAVGFLADGRPVGNCFSDKGFGVVWTDGEPQPLIVNGRKGSVKAVGPDWIAGSISQAGSRFRQAVVWWQEGLTFRPEIIGEAKKHTEALGVRLATPWQEKLISFVSSEVLVQNEPIEKLLDTTLIQVSDRGVCGYLNVSPGPLALVYDESEQVRFLPVPPGSASRAMATDSTTTVGSVMLISHFSTTTSIGRPALWRNGDLHILDERDGYACAVEGDLILGTVNWHENGRLFFEMVLWQGTEIIATLPGIAHTLSPSGQISGVHIDNYGYRGFVAALTGI